MNNVKYACSKLIEAKAWWDKDPPQPTYDKNVRVKTDKSLGYIVVGIAILWVAAQMAPFIGRAF